MDRLIAEWIVKGGKRFIRLYAYPEGGYHYMGKGQGGTLPKDIITDDKAIEYMESKSGAVTILRLDFPSVKRIK